MNILNKFLSKFKIKYKYIFVILPFVFLSYLIIGYGLYYISFELNKGLITQQAEQYIIEKTSYFDKYLDNLTTSTDKMFYNNEMQGYLLQQQSNLQQEEYVALKDSIQKFCYSHLTKGDERLYDVDIRNVYIKNMYDEIIITDAVYSDTLDRVKKLMELYEKPAQKLHGQVYLAHEAPNHLYYVRTIYKNDIDNCDKQIGMDIIESNNNKDISFALIDDSDNVVINSSNLSNQECYEIIQENTKKIDNINYKGISHSSLFSDYKIVGIINETSLYNGFYKILWLVFALILLSIIIIISSILFASQVVSNQFNKFILKLKKTDTIDEHALIQSQSKDEFDDLCRVYNEMIKRVDVLSKAVYEKELSLKNAEIQAFQAQINPHFLYNTLDCINSLVGMNKIEETQKTVVALANIMRMSIKGPNFLTIENEIKYIKEYIFIQKMRYQERILFLIEIDDKLNHYVIPKLILQPIVENAIKHGVSNMTKQGMIAILGKFKDDKIVFTIRDNGVGMSDEIINKINNYSMETFIDDKENNNSIGLINIQKRIRLIYGQDYGMVIKKLNNGGTEVKIFLSKKLEQ